MTTQDTTKTVTAHVPKYGAVQAIYRDGNLIDSGLLRLKPRLPEKVFAAAEAEGREKASPPKFLLVVGDPDFSATQVEVVPNDAAKGIFAELFGAGAVSVTLPKSKALELDRFIGQKIG